MSARRIPTSGVTPTREVAFSRLDAHDSPFNTSSADEHSFLSRHSHSSCSFSMNRSSSPQLPESFDPAVYLHSEKPEDASHPPAFSDDLRALDAYTNEIRAANNRKGIVIQHRSGTTLDAFRSEDDYRIGPPCLF
jgi:hypothetical protein